MLPLFVSTVHTARSRIKSKRRKIPRFTFCNPSNSCGKNHVVEVRLYQLRDDELRVYDLRPQSRFGGGHRHRHLRRSFSCSFSRTQTEKMSSIAGSPPPRAVQARFDACEGRGAAVLPRPRSVRYTAYRSPRKRQT